MANTKPPRFKNEAQEAEWWAKHQGFIADRFEQAKAAGTLGKGTVARLARDRTEPIHSMPESGISIIDLGKQLGKVPQTIHKVVRRLKIAPKKMRSSDHGGQVISYITNDEARRVIEHVSTGRAAGAEAERRGSNSEVLLTESEGYFYVMNCEPELDPGRFKVGFATDVHERLRRHRTSAPHIRLERQWPCKLLWEKTAIDCATDGCERLGTEVFRTSSMESVIAKCEDFFSVMPKLACSASPGASELRHNRKD